MIGSPDIALGLALLSAFVALVASCLSSLALLVLALPFAVVAAIIGLRGRRMDVDLVVTGCPSGDGECWCFVVDEAEYRRVVGEEMYEIEMTCRREAQDGSVFAPSLTDFALDPWDILRAAGYEGLGPVTLHIRVQGLGVS